MYDNNKLDAIRMTARIATGTLMILGGVLLLIGLSLLSVVPPFPTQTSIPTPFALVGVFSVMPAGFIVSSTHSLTGLGLVGHLDPPLLSLRGVAVIYFAPGIFLVAASIALIMSLRSRHP